MASSEELSYTFLESHPVDAARVLERLDAAAAAALLQSAPIRLAAPVLRQMLPLAAAHCLSQLDDVAAVGMLRGVGVQAGVALLRHIVAERRTNLLTQLPTALSLAYELLLGYPEGTIGSWMDPHALALPADMRCDDALERVRLADENHMADPFVVDSNQRLLGYVELADLLRASAATPLLKRIRSNTHRVPSMAMIAGLREHPGWREASVLPVVDRDNRLVGAISHAALQRALSIDVNSVVQTQSNDTLVDIASTYWFGVTALIQALVSFLPVERREDKI